jgi:hypothetical protein
MGIAYKIRIIRQKVADSIGRRQQKETNKLRRNNIEDCKNSQAHIQRASRKKQHKGKKCGHYNYLPDYFVNKIFFPTLFLTATHFHSGPAKYQDWQKPQR